MREVMEYASVSGAAEMIRNGDASAQELTRLMLDRIDKMNGTLNAFITVTADSALAQAAEADRELAEGRDRGPLHGIPVAIKDLIDTRGVLTTGGSLLEARDALRDEAGVEVGDALVIVDRDEGGTERLAEEGIRVTSLFTRHDFLS